MIAGSSPLARGLLMTASVKRTGAGIIPARAGFTPMSLPDSPGSRDHPRSRGVYGADVGGRVAGGGSSPLARGLHRSESHMSFSTRIIPARAGFTCEPEPFWLDDDGSSPLARGLLVNILFHIVAAWDHPRSRGVYAPSMMVLVSESGSSPLARGLPRYLTRAEASEGIIPARAGFTVRVRKRPTPGTDHPRSRGVYA